jgi:phospholipase/lecithinase/hemolysin
VAPNPDQYLFWDNIHPTETFQRLLGTRAIQATSE